MDHAHLLHLPGISGGNNHLLGFDVPETANTGNSFLLLQSNEMLALFTIL